MFYITYYLLFIMCYYIYTNIYIYIIHSFVVQALTRGPALKSPFALQGPRGALQAPLGPRQAQLGLHLDLQTGLQAQLGLHLALQTALQASLGLHLPLQTGLQAPLGLHFALQTGLQAQLGLHFGLPRAVFFVLLPSTALPFSNKARPTKNLRKP